MSRHLNGYRKLVADALSPKRADDHSGVLVISDLQFKPSFAALQKADEVRQRVRSEMAELTAEEG